MHSIRVEQLHCSGSFVMLPKSFPRECRHPSVLRTSGARHGLSRATQKTQRSSLKTHLRMRRGTSSPRHPLTRPYTQVRHVLVDLPKLLVTPRSHLPACLPSSCDLAILPPEIVSKSSPKCLLLLDLLCCASTFSPEENSAAVLLSKPAFPQSFLSEYFFSVPKI